MSEHLLCLLHGTKPWEGRTWSTETTLPTSLNQYDSGLRIFTCSKERGRISTDVPMLGLQDRHRCPCLLGQALLSSFEPYSSSTDLPHRSLAEGLARGRVTGSRLLKKCRDTTAGALGYKYQGSGWLEAHRSATLGTNGFALLSLCGLGAQRL